ncbi:hypothetical protein ACI78V_16180 [Geodermatophilus sp. SYSU D00742]
MLITNLQGVLDGNDWPALMEVDKASGQALMSAANAMTEIEAVEVVEEERPPQA